VETDEKWLIPLSRAAEADESLVGSKALQLGRILRFGRRVPNGFVLTAHAYERFIQESRLTDVIRMELGRKPFSEMRWEEIWDTALRIRSAFVAASIPKPLTEAIGGAVDTLEAHAVLAVRSSAPGEDSADRSFAGLHESFLGIEGPGATLNAVRLVWASLWSDAALLYRKELSLDPARSRMAVIIQEVVESDRSGVAFGRDPRNLELDHQIIEAVPGPCSDLVDGVVDPDRWVLARRSGEVIEYRQGVREAATAGEPILEPEDLKATHCILKEIEQSFGWPPDVEWTGRGDRLTLLQARPITTGSQEDDTREWYLTLRPAPLRLKQLSRRVVHELIPQLESEGRELASENLEEFDNTALAAAIEKRLAEVQRWRQTYRDEFIPFAHGVRRLGIYYNDVVQPKDPYEFTGLLRGEAMLATKRNLALEELALSVRDDSELRQILQEANASSDSMLWKQRLATNVNRPAGEGFLRKLEEFEAQYMDTAFAGERLAERPDLLLSLLLELADSEGRSTEKDGETSPRAQPSVQDLESRLLKAVGASRQSEAAEVLEIARLSWRLRDDDNLLLGRLESQLIRALHLAAERLRDQGRLKETHLSEKDASILAEALRKPSSEPLRLSKPETEGAEEDIRPGESPRQLIGQPAAPGIATGLVRRVRRAEDLARFRANEILVCDSIQPNMTHLVPLSSAIVERRGGMLIHGAIIARELGIPCVNGVPKSTEILQDGDLVTVDGYLGIVTVGAAEFELEKALSLSKLD
jgi:pyruvate,water dikinase